MRESTAGPDRRSPTHRPCKPPPPLAAGEGVQQRGRPEERRLRGGRERERERERARGGGDGVVGLKIW